jgi:hypothetical protein
MTGSVKEAGKFLNIWTLSDSQNDLERSSGVPGRGLQISVQVRGQRERGSGVVAP